MLRNRIFEYTNPQIEKRFQIDKQPDFTLLSTLPTLFLEETSGKGDQIAHVGAITRIAKEDSWIETGYVYDAEVPPIPNKVLQEFAKKLDIHDWEFSRTHWAVKNVDLFRQLICIRQPRRLTPQIFQLSKLEAIRTDFISVMMPFRPEFDAVYSILQKTAEFAGFQCKRADDIWENPTVIQDVVALIDRSSVVICDCTSRNPNVFYEMGIAHTLGREVILITQSEADIPFDIQHLRYLTYLNNGEGRQNLSERLQMRLAHLSQ